MNNYLSKSVLFVLGISILLGISLPAFYAATRGNYFIYEPDAYMHMVIARDFLVHPGWHSAINYSINSPFGADTHGWTQSVTLLLSCGTLFLNLFVSLQQALYLCSFTLPVLFNLLAAFTLLWAIKPLTSHPWQPLFVLVSFLVNPFMHSMYLPLRVDYDFLLIFLSILYWGCFFRVLGRPTHKWTITAAVSAVLGLWTSIAFIIPLLLSLTVVGWRIEYSRLPSYVLYYFLITVCIGLAFVIPLEHEIIFYPAYDIVSIVYFTFFILLLGGFRIYESLIKHLTPFKRVLGILSLLLVLFCVQNYLFPGFYKGPYNGIPAEILRHFFPLVGEFYSPFNIDVGVVLTLFFYFILGAGYLAYLYLDQRLLPERINLLYLAVILNILTGYMYRWSEFATPINIILISFLVADYCKKQHSALLQLILALALACLPMVLILFTKEFLSPTEQRCEEQLYSMMKDKYLDQESFQRDQILFIHNNYSPFILYNSHFFVVGTNDHHNPQGLMDSLNFFKEDETDAYNMLRKRKVDLILLCTSHLPRFSTHSVRWLQPIALPTKYINWQLYRVVYQR